MNMTTKKDFSSVNTGRLYSSIEQSMSRKGQQGTASPQEAAERAEELRTQGRKGCKAVRINMAFTPENHKFIKVMARINGQTMTEFVNLIVQHYRMSLGKEKYEKAMAFIDEMFDDEEGKEEE